MSEGKKHGWANSERSAHTASRKRLFLLITTIISFSMLVMFMYSRAFFLTPQKPATQSVPSKTISEADKKPEGSKASFQSLAATSSTINQLPQGTPSPPKVASLILVPDQGSVGWWMNNSDTNNRHVGDSFLYAGYYDNKVFISAFQIDLSSIPDAESIASAFLELTGLSDRRFNAAADEAWRVSLLHPGVIDNFHTTDFQALFNAPAEITLLPTLGKEDLAVGKKNRWELDETAITWMARQKQRGQNKIIIRIIGPTRGTETLFAWDSGYGPATAGIGPKLILILAKTPETLPSPTTSSYLVATLTPTPQNVLTAAANAHTATAIANTTGTFTPPPPNIVTPTPIPANLATVQANALRLGLPPVVPHTPTPANAATATLQALYATAVAITTGTFTPVPTDAVTPVIITPTPAPVDLAAFVAWALTATARPPGPSTPWPYNALVATPTLTPWFITATPTPANAATATYQSLYATAVTLSAGTFTPRPPNVVVLPYGVTVTPVSSKRLRIGERAIIHANAPVNMRSGPGIDFISIVSLSPGQPVKIIDGPQPGTTFNWWLVQVQTTSGQFLRGWIADDLLSPSQ